MDVFGGFNAARLKARKLLFARTFCERMVQRVNVRWIRYPHSLDACLFILRCILTHDSF
jgi:hypothetical protein